jgi:hypothetical protein
MEIMKQRAKKCETHTVRHGLQLANGDSYDYWGPEDNWHNHQAWNTVTGNYLRAQVGGQEGWFGDWWYVSPRYQVYPLPPSGCSILVDRHVSGDYLSISVYWSEVYTPSCSF